MVSYSQPKEKPKSIQAPITFSRKGLRQLDRHSSLPPILHPETVDVMIFDLFQSESSESEVKQMKLDFKIAEK